MALLEAASYIRSSVDVETVSEPEANRLSSFLNALLDRNDYNKVKKFDTDATDHLVEILRVISELEAEAVVDQLFEDIEACQEPIGFAKLNENEKSQIHSLLAKIRQLIESSDISDRKKNALYHRLAALHEEVDLVATSTDRFFAFMGDIAFTAGEMAKNAKPVVDAFKEIMSVLNSRRAEDEGVRLPSPDEILRLPGSDTEGEAK
ncbi:hypothetical protein [Maricaulis virginensis]|uniref:hypothetical protein n=1 Tax=Maricaulis virginensis TaxID=144022 RepID=UPI0022F297CD|nr:hypothetical protein [Maricaulis virginensis]